ncbi:hypothetical protein [Oceanobacillus sp. Castelsardo]|uniref:hypothetical protein n=1 Tax=Oceanobacillus sp. Castelsardo TaxID=1851204 RepID=UPI000837B0D3|nr:hypothetical protein [Oceanobacillus sp. Castelsardo]
MGFFIIIFGFIFFIKKNITKLFCLYLFVNLSIPFNNYIHYKLVLEWKGVETTDILLLFLLILLVINFINIGVNIRFSKLDFIIAALFIFVVIYTFIGLQNNNEFLLSDVKTFIYFFINYVMFRSLINKDNYLSVIKTFLNSSFVYSIVVLSLYLFMQDYLPYIYGERLYAWWGNRITFSNTTLFILTIPLLLFVLIKNVFPKYKLYFSIVLLSNVISLLLSQTRTLILLCIFNCLIVLLLLLYKSYGQYRINWKLGLRLFGLLFFLTTTFIVSTYIGTSQEIISDIVNRFQSNEGSLDVREISNEMAANEIERNPLGYGLGKELVLYNVDYTISSAGAFIDNIFYTLGVKVGVIGVLIFIIILLSIFIGFISNFRKNKLFMALLIILYLSFLITSAVLNAQIIYSVPVLIMFIMFITVPLKVLSYK